MEYGLYFQNCKEKLGLNRWGRVTTLSQPAGFARIFSSLIGTDISELYKLLGGSIDSADGFYCFYCKDEGELENCDSCQEGEVPCDEGCEQGYWTCEVCDGDPEIMCDVCGGGNLVDCPLCMEGYINCETCEGLGHIACEQEGCEEGNINCEKCKGIGDCEEEGCEGGIIPCDCDDFDTPDGTVPCDDCEAGLQRCDNCNAEGEIICPECENDGYNDCDNWNCNEGFVTCEYCDDGVVECGDCEGGWEGNICVVCDGRISTDNMVNIREWNNLTPSVASFSKKDEQ